MVKIYTNTPYQAHLPYGVAALLLSGGVFAYYRKRSAPSLMGASAFALAFFYAGRLISQNELERGHTVGAVAGGALGAVMGARLLTTKKFMPAGVVAIIGTGAGVYHAAKLSEIWG